jgi:UDP-N-acetylmuramoyl-tripeptide--D-alanyl-D-alanine ligase
VSEAITGGVGASFTLEEVLTATRGDLVALGSRTSFPGIVTDSRRLRQGELFLAIRGDTHDGHDFVASAVSAGAGAIVVERTSTDRLRNRALPCAMIVVRDTLAALGDLAACHRQRHRTRIVAITGSNGKTTTKEMLAAILTCAFGAERILKTTGTQNNLVGLPLTLLRLRDGMSAAIVELGMNAPGEIWRLAEIARPDVGVITSLAPAHLQGLGSIEGVAVAKGELYRCLRPSATAVVNADEPLLLAQARAFPGHQVRFGVGDAASVGEPAPAVRATDIVDQGLDGFAFRLAVEGREAAIQLGLPGAHNVTNVLAAAAAAHALGVSFEAVREGLAHFQPPPMRMEIVRLPSGVTVLNDAYNANPASMAAALRTLAASRGGRRLAALGDMRELGSQTAEAHRALGAVAAGVCLDALFLLGDHAGEVRAGAEGAGMGSDRIIVGSSHEDLAARLGAYCRAGDVLLVKGSRGAAMEEVLSRLGAPGQAGHPRPVGERTP